MLLRDAVSVAWHATLFVMSRNGALVDKGLQISTKGVKDEINFCLSTGIWLAPKLQNDQDKRVWVITEMQESLQTVSSLPANGLQTFAKIKSTEHRTTLHKAAAPFVISLRSSLVLLKNSN